jgi:signal transduction histidine kinase
VDATGFRVVQEALTNAARHAPGAPVSVRARATAGALDLAIVNGPVPRARRGLGGPGFGLVGMQERVTDAGGSLEVGPTPTGGYVVHAVLPWESPSGSGSSRPWSSGGLGRAASRWVDLAVPAGWLVALVIEALTSSHRAGPLVANVVVVATMALAAGLRRRRPVVFLAAVGVLALCLSDGLTGRGYGTLAGFYTVLVPTYCLGSWASRRTVTVALPAWAGVVTVAGLVQDASLGGLLGPLMAGGLATTVGMIVGSQRELNRRLAASYALARSESDRLEKLSADRERARLAEELHAPVAHLVKRMVDSAEAAIGLLDTGSSAVSDALAKIETDGREALMQMRLVLGALRSAASGVSSSYDAPGDAGRSARGTGALWLPA